MNTIQDMLVRLSDIIDMHDYDENWEIKAQGLITKISNELNPKELKEVFPGTLDQLDKLTIWTLTSE